MPPELGDRSWISDIPDIECRLGLHIGPIAAGALGSKRLQYDVWADTVNTVSRMESTSQPGRIQVSEAFANDLRSGTESTESGVGSGLRSLTAGLRERGDVEVKGKGTMTTFWLEP